MRSFPGTPSWTLCGVLSFLLVHVHYCNDCSACFWVPTSRLSLRSSSSSSNSNDDKPRRSRSSNNNQQQQQQVLTIAEWRDQLLQNPAQFLQPQPPPKKNGSRSNKKKTAAATTTASHRTRRRVDQPQQTYLYASQRKQLPPPNATLSSTTAAAATTTTTTATATATTTNEETLRLQQLRRREWVQELGLQLASVQHCDPVPVEPVLVGQILVQETTSTTDDDDDNSSQTKDRSSSSSSSQYAYLIDKPAGWSILGTNNNKQRKKKTSKPPKEASIHKTNLATDNDHETSLDVLEYQEADVLALLTPQEREEYLQSQTDDNDDQDNDEVTDGAENDNNNDNNNSHIIHTRRPSVVAWLKEWKASQGTPIRGGNFWTAVAGASQVDDSGLLLLCPKKQIHNVGVERAEYTAVLGNGGYLAPTTTMTTTTTPRSKITRSENNNNNNNKETTTTKTPITTTTSTLESIQTNVMARLRKGRGDDVVETVQIVIADRPSVCADAVPVCQTKFGQGIRGDAAGSPLDRFAPRRLIHCRTLAVSSRVQHVDHDHHHPHLQLTHTTETLPDDIAVWSERRNHLQYTQGSFLGRKELRTTESTTTAYREINGAADGFPGWTVDRYGEWLLVSHDPKQPRGPLPSIHDGYTAGVYYLENEPQQQPQHRDRGRINGPRLLEGRAAPDLIPIQENGITYLVSLDRGDLSTGLFLDQRPQRAWLARHCTPETRLLNCFAHTGAFSVAAAAAGASTVNLDLSQKWLDRFPQHLQANGIAWNEVDGDDNDDDDDDDTRRRRRHDCIYGDCFDWLVRLAKRGEKYDIVILDPPSSSVGTKKKRWSVKNDMSELVALAAGLVRKGGLLWTTTNSKSIPAEKFARLCRKGLDDAGLKNAKLERIQPMPVDFPSIGPQPVKNLVWRIPS